MNSQSYHRITANIDILPNMTWRFSDFQRLIGTHVTPGPVAGKRAHPVEASGYHAVPAPKRTRRGVNPVDPVSGKRKRGRPAKDSKVTPPTLGV